MRLSPLRWSLACLLGCALIAVTLLPPGHEDDSSAYYYWQSPVRLRELRMQRREGVVARHSGLLYRNFRAAQDSEAAVQLFGTHHDTAAAPIVTFAPDIPAALRRRVADLIASERTSRGAWSGHGAVGVMVVADTATAVEGVPLRTFRPDRPTFSILPATGANGDHCVTVIRLGHGALAGRADFSRYHLPLDGCAFTDAFGAPGPRIAEWLRSTRYQFARRLALSTGVPEKYLQYWMYDQGGINSMKCRGGADSACLAAVQGPQDDAFGYAGYWSDRSVPPPFESAESWRDIADWDETLLEALARDLGPARFQRVWRSQRALPEAYYDETGASFAGWIRARLTSIYGRYHTGPAPTREASLLILVTILALAAISVRLAPRPYAT